VVIPDNMKAIVDKADATDPKVNDAFREYAQARGFAVDPTRIELVAAGPEALVGALEMACTLGPLDALVETIEAEEEQGPVPAGFEVRL